ncbi:MAG: LysR family transcriptional regulator [Planctomycetota bacterium]
MLNYHHLHYFWAVAKEGSLTRAAERLHVSQSALSTQIRQLESSLGQALFVRAPRAMRLTEAGQVALSFAERIFTTGDEMVAVLREEAVGIRTTLRIGAVATLSRNFQENFFRPLLARTDVDLVLQSASLSELLARLRVHNLDLILSNRRIVATADDPWRCRRIARQPVSLVGHRRRGRKPFRFPEDLADTLLILPGPDSDVRAGFDVMCRRIGLRPRVLAEVDDMALLRLIARDSKGVALVPSVVVQDELRTGRLVEHAVVPDLFEDFYAITVQRRFAPPMLDELLQRDGSEILGQSESSRDA